MLKVALVGRTNVGKSTLFNCLTRCRDALVADTAELTRDRRYGCIEERGQRWLLVDTGGLVDSTSAADTALARQVSAQTEWAIEEADLVCLVVDAREGLTGADEDVTRRLRRAGKCSWLVVNKVDTERYAAMAEFAPLGLQPCFYTEALQQRGIKDLRLAMVEQAGRHPGSVLSSGEPDNIRVTFLGRPNVGKSTLLNRLVGEPRMLTGDLPGTTRDSIVTPFGFNGDHFALVDTAGVRRRSKVDDRVEKFSALKTLENVVLSDVVVLVCDACDGITAQDTALADQAVSAGRALVVAINKCDLVRDSADRRQLDRSRDLKLRFLPWVEVLELSALSGQGTKRLMRKVVRAHAAAQTRVATPESTRLLRAAVEHYPPPLVAGKRIKLRYAHQGGIRPPRFIVYGSFADSLPAAYRRYLENFFRERLRLIDTPIVFEFKRTGNRFVE